MDARQLRALQQMFSQRADKDDGLVNFRAGRLFLDQQTRMVNSDKKRGKIRLLKDEQGLVKFQWFNRISNQKELDLTIFPQTAKWEKVNECKDGRVYVLRMMGSDRKHFFWSQEPKEDKDEEWFTNINKLCNGESIADDKSNTSGANASASNPYAAALGGATGGNTGDASNNAVAQMILNALNQQGGANPPASAAASGASGAAASGAGGAQPDLLAQMANMMREQQRAAVEEMKREPDLEDILDPNANKEIMELLDDEKIVEELAQHLPESMRSRSDIVDQLQSPQFQGALRRLQSAINGPQMPTLLSQMNINGADQNAMGVTAFVNAIQPEDAKDKEKEKEKEKQDEDGDAQMEDKDKKKDKEDKDKEKGSSDDINDIYK
eukprot:485284_1